MAPMSTWLDSGGQGKVSAVELEGVYLKGQGVVYSVTLPPPAQDPRATARMSAKARSDWERMRQALRRGKPEAQEKPRAVRSPSLTETILKVLAKNGRHFSWLGDEESLTVVITFRAPRQSITPRASASSLTFPNPSYRPNQAVFAPQNSAGGEGGGYRTRDYELLGDLHLKQGRAQEGLNAYQKGIELEPENAKLVRLWRKIAQAYLTLGKDDQAAKALEMVLKIEKKTAQPVDKKAAKSSMPLPAKLIISAPKKLLEQLDKITYEEFHKGATVQYLTFSKP